MKIIFKLDSSLNEELKLQGLSIKTLNTLLSLITNKYIYSNDDEEGVKIHSNIFANFNSNYKKYLEILRSKEIIYWDHYEVGVKARNYFFTEQFKNNAVISKIISDENDEQTYKDQDNSIIIKNLVKENLYKNLLSCNVDLSKVKRTFFLNGDRDVCEFKSYILSYLNAYRIKENKLFFNLKSKRLYTPFTYCNKKTRTEAFNFNSNPIVSLDIPSSFPLFLTLWALQNGVDKDDYDFKEWCGYIKEGRNKDKAVVYSELRKLFDKLKDSDSTPKYIKEYNISTTIEKRHISYEESKKFFMIWLNTDYKDNFIHNVFKQYFESLHNIKTTDMYDKIVAMETEFVMNNLLLEIYTKIPDIKIITVHDEIYFEDIYYNKVKDIWNSKIKDLYNLLPVNEDIDINLNDEFILKSDIKMNTIKPKNPNSWSERNKNVNWDDIFWQS